MLTIVQVLQRHINEWDSTQHGNMTVVLTYGGIRGQCKKGAPD